MGQPTQEIEVKLPFDSAAAAREAVKRLGATTRTPRHFEDNIVFDRGDRSLETAGVTLRVRTRGDEAILTLKLPVAGDHRHKVREEHETSVGDAETMIRLFAGLGYEPRWRYQKFRTVYALDELAICLDETPIGCFVELEGPPDQIDAVAERLGFASDQYVCGSYRELGEQEAARRGVEIGDMLIDATGEPR
jgi:adenylate cyclase class 2